LGYIDRPQKVGQQMSSHMGIGWAYTMLLLIGITGGLGDVWIYHWVKTNRWLWLVAACVVWVASLLLFGLFLKWDTRSFTTAFILSSVFHVLLVGVSDLWFFGGKIGRLEWLGILLGVLSAICIELGRERLPEEVELSAVAVNPTKQEEY
jgi:drug/metabolite transporter (DMT)-like permease